MQNDCRVTNPETGKKEASGFFYVEEAAGSSTTVFVLLRDFVRKGQCDTSSG